MYYCFHDSSNKIQKCNHKTEEWLLTHSSLRAALQGYCDAVNFQTFNTDLKDW